MVMGWGRNQRRLRGLSRWGTRCLTSRCGFIINESLVTWGITLLNHFDPHQGASSFMLELCLELELL